MGLFTSAGLKSHQAGAKPTGAAAADASPATVPDWALAPELEAAIDALWARLRRPGPGPSVLAHQAFAITHWEPDEGATTLATALALHAAELHPSCSFCLADFDFFNPGLSQLMGLEAEPGLSNVLCQEAALDGVLAGTRLPNLSVVPAGYPSVGRRIAELEDLCRAVCEQLVARFNYVILDMPLLREHPNSAMWASGLAEAVLVVRAGQARQPAVAQAMRTLRLMRLKITAVALNSREYYVPNWLYART
jgi:Mrp family chromosome partitioning ATPase